MKIKGLSFQQFKLQIIYEFGEERWNNFFQMFKASYPFFNQAILAVTPIPAEKFITFLDAMLKNFIITMKKYIGDLVNYPPNFP